MPTDDGWPPAFQYIISDFLHVHVTCVIGRESSFVSYFTCRD